MSQRAKHSTCTATRCAHYHQPTSEAVHGYDPSANTVYCDLRGECPLLATERQLEQARTECGNLLRAAKSAQTAWVKATIHSTPGNAEAMLALYRVRAAEYNVAVAKLHQLEATAKREAFEASLSTEQKAAREQRLAAQRAASAERMAAEREARRAERMERRGR